MAAFLDIHGPVVADSCYVNNKLVARDVAATLPEVAPSTADLRALGTMSVPIWQLLDNMEMSITKIGVDKGLSDMLKPEPLPMELRWMHTVTDANGATKNVQCKAFLRGIPSRIPGIGIEPGSASENEFTQTVTRYQLIVDGKELWLIDRLAGIVRIGGKDYASDLNSFL